MYRTYPEDGESRAILGVPCPSPRVPPARLPVSTRPAPTRLPRTPADATTAGHDRMAHPLAGVSLAGRPRVPSLPTPGQHEAGTTSADSSLPTALIPALLPADRAGRLMPLPCILPSRFGPVNGLTLYAPYSPRETVHPAYVLVFCPSLTLIPCIQISSSRVCTAGDNSARQPPTPSPAAPHRPGPCPCPHPLLITLWINKACKAGKQMLQNRTLPPAPASPSVLIRFDTCVGLVSRPYL
jgi:hypothetical protein